MFTGQAPDGNRLLNPEALNEVQLGLILPVRAKNRKLTGQAINLTPDRAHGVGGDHVDQQIVRREGEFSQSVGDSGHKRPVRSVIDRPNGASDVHP